MDLNVELNTIKLLEENKREKFHDIGFGNNSKSTGSKRKNRQIRYHQNLMLYSS